MRNCPALTYLIGYGTRMALRRFEGGTVMLGITRMAKEPKAAGKNQRAKGRENSSRVVKVRLTVSDAEAYNLGRVSRWEKQSEGTSFELTGRI